MDPGDSRPRITGDLTRPPRAVSVSRHKLVHGIRSVPDDKQADLQELLG